MCVWGSDKCRCVSFACSDLFFRLSQTLYHSIFQNRSTPGSADPMLDPIFIPSSLLEKRRRASILHVLDSRQLRSRPHNSHSAVLYAQMSRSFQHRLALTLPIVWRRCSGHLSTLSHFKVHHIRCWTPNGTIGCPLVNV